MLALYPERGQKGELTMKKCTSLVLAALFAANALTGYAESDARIVSRAAPVAALERGAAAAAPVAEVPSDYERLIAYRTEDYARKSVAEFNRLLMPEMSGIFEAHARVMETLTPEDANHDFIAITLNASLSEIYSEALNDEAGFWGVAKREERPVQPLNEAEEAIMANQEQTYAFAFYAFYTLYDEIAAPDSLTIAERDAALRTFCAEFQAHVDRLSEAELSDAGIQESLQAEANALADALSTEGLRLRCEVHSLSGNCGGAEIENS